MLPLDWLSVAGNTIFLASYVVFVYHIYRTKKVEGVSVTAVLLWWIAFSLLAIFFLGKWAHSGLRWEMLFFLYYLAGSALSVIALRLLRCYREERGA